MTVQLLLLGTLVPPMYVPQYAGMGRLWGMKNVMLVCLKDVLKTVSQTLKITLVKEETLHPPQFAQRSEMKNRNKQKQFKQQAK